MIFKILFDSGEMFNFFTHKSILRINKQKLNNINIIGTFRINHKIINKYNKKNKPYHLFKPFRHDLPKMLVILPSKVKGDEIMKNTHNTSWNIYVKYLFWNEDDFYPIAEVKQIFGSSESIKATLNSLSFDDHILSKKNQNKFNTINSQKMFESILKKETKKRRMIDKNVYSIDPVNNSINKDIDDAISYCRINEYTIEIGIHIADVSFWVKKLKLWKYIEDKSFTLYTKNKRYDIFPLSLTNLFSLYENETKLCVSYFMYFDIKNENNVYLKECKFEKTVIKCKQNYHYSSIFSQSIKNIHKYINLFINPKKNENIKNSKKLIEYLMVTYNKEAGQYLSSKNINFIKRCDTNPINGNTYTKNDNFNNFYNNINNNAFYTISIEDTKHFALNINNYGHFTSPIRRSCDIYNQLILSNAIDNVSCNDIKLPNICTLNLMEKYNKQIQRKINQINIISNIPENTEIDCNAIIYSISELDVLFYILEHNITYEYKLLENPSVLKYNIINHDQVNIQTKNGLKILKKFEKISGKLKKTINLNLQFDIISY